MTYQDILRHFGGDDDHNGKLSKAARALGIPISTLSDWRAGVPYGRQCEIQIITGGALRAEERTRA